MYPGGKGGVACLNLSPVEKGERGTAWGDKKGTPEEERVSSHSSRNGGTFPCSLVDLILMAFSLLLALTFWNSVLRGGNDQIPGELGFLLQKCYLPKNVSNPSFLGQGKDISINCVPTQS